MEGYGEGICVNVSECIKLWHYNYTAFYYCYSAIKTYHVSSSIWRLHTVKEMLPFLFQTLLLVILQYCDFLFLSIAALKFLKHPRNVNTQPGLSVEFSITTSQPVRICNWYFQENLISSEDADYIGSTTDSLTIAKCLPKHKGTYKCVVTDEFDETHSSKVASLTMGKFLDNSCVCE